MGLRDLFKFGEPFKPGEAFSDPGGDMQANEEERTKYYEEHEDREKDKDDD
jgi:hypothetical protein